MLQKANLPDSQLIAALAQHYGLTVTNLQFLPIGYDARSFLYQATTANNQAYFLKLRSVPVPLPTLLIPQRLIQHGFPNFIAPVKTLTGDLTCNIDPYTLILYPFIHGHDAMQIGLTPAQWTQFGATLAAVHNSDLAQHFPELPTESFSFPTAPRLLSVLAAAQETNFQSPASQELASFIAQQTPLLQQMLARAQALGHQLQSQPFNFVLCHTDCHTANILISDSGNLYLVDWDSPMLAPRERDLFLVLPPQIPGQAVTPQQAAFFTGYGSLPGYGSPPLNHAALAYYRYERALEDLTESGYTGLLDPHATEPDRLESLRFTRWLFDPNLSIHHALAEDNALSL
jgi:spectinomycin phosphotransferase